MQLLRLKYMDGHSAFVLPSTDLEQHARWYWPIQSVTVVEACGYDTGAGWNPARCGESIPCSRHDSYRCDYCGKPATEACCHAGSQFVCGEPLCADHTPTCRRHRY